MAVALAVAAMGAAAGETEIPEGYRRLWNDELNAAIDARIEKFRKADACVEAAVAMGHARDAAVLPRAYRRGGVADIYDEELHLQRRSCWSQNVLTYPSSVPARALSRAATQTLRQAGAFGHFGFMTSCVTAAICVRATGSPS